MIHFRFGGLGDAVEASFDNTPLLPMLIQNTPRNLPRPLLCAGQESLWGEQNWHFSTSFKKFAIRADYYRKTQCTVPTSRHCRIPNLLKTAAILCTTHSALQPLNRAWKANGKLCPTSLSECYDTWPRENRGGCVYWYDGFRKINLLYFDLFMMSRTKGLVLLLMISFIFAYTSGKFQSSWSLGTQCAIRWPASLRRSLVSVRHLEQLLCSSLGFVPGQPRMAWQWAGLPH